jgi:hypothetical protein
MRNELWIVKGLQPNTRVALRFDRVTGLIEQGEGEPGLTRISTQHEEYVTQVPFEEALRGWMDWLAKGEDNDAK